VVAVVSLNMLGLLIVFMPASVPLRVQEWLSERPELASPVKLRVQPSSGGAGLIGRGKNANMRIALTIVAGDIPRGPVGTDVEIRSDAVSVGLEWPDRKWVPATKPGVNRRSESDSEAVFDMALSMDPALFREKRESPVIIRGSIFLTLFGEEEKRTVSLGNGPVNVQDGLQCQAVAFTEQSEALFCRSFFRWPARLVYARSGDQQSDFINSRISYSPFPANLSLDPGEMRWGDPVKTNEVTIVTKRPLVHFHREFEMRGVTLADFQKQRPIFRPGPVRQ
jgi:hypothetical protein